MAQKVNLRQIANTFNNNARIFGSKYRVTTQVTNSTDEFDNKYQLIFTNFASLIIHMAVSFYEIKEFNQKLSPEIITKIEKYREFLIRQFFEDAGDSEKLVELSMFLINRFQIEHNTKSEVISKNLFIFDDISPSHLAAFKAENVSEIPKKNILIKIKFEATHMRMGIKIDVKNKSITILDFTKKSTKNK